VRHVARRVPGSLVGDLDPHPVLVEGNVPGELGQGCRGPQALRQAFDRVDVGLDVGQGK